MEYLPLQSSPDKIHYLSLEWRKDITGKNEENLNKIHHLVNSIGSVLIYYLNTHLSKETINKPIRT